MRTDALYVTPTEADGRGANGTPPSQRTCSLGGRLKAVLPRLPGTFGHISINCPPAPNHRRSLRFPGSVLTFGARLSQEAPVSASTSVGFLLAGVAAAVRLGPRPWVWLTVFFDLRAPQAASHPIAGLVISFVLCDTSPAPPARHRTTAEWDRWVGTGAGATRAGLWERGQVPTHFCAVALPPWAPP